MIYNIRHGSFNGTGPDPQKTACRTRSRKLIAPKFGRASNPDRPEARRAHIRQWADRPLTFSYVRSPLRLRTGKQAGILELEWVVAWRRITGLLIP